MKVIETTLAENSDNKYVTSNVLLSAAIDDKIHLDGLYFFLRREPDLLLKLLSVESTDNSSNNNDVSIATVDSRNRKRKRKKR